MMQRHIRFYRRLFTVIFINNNYLVEQAKKQYFQNAIPNSKDSKTI